MNPGKDWCVFECSAVEVKLHRVSDQSCFLSRIRIDSCTAWAIFQTRSFHGSSFWISAFIATYHVWHHTGRITTRTVFRPRKGLERESF